MSEETKQKEKPKPAKPCPKCGGYYPGDCTCGYNCNCDGCNTLREMEKPENHIHNFNSTAGDTEYDGMGDEFLVMECNCGETELMPTGVNYYDDERAEPTLGYNDDDLGV